MNHTLVARCELKPAPANAFKLHYLGLLFCLFMVGCAALLPVSEGPALEKDTFRVLPKKYRLQAIEHEGRKELYKALFCWQIVHSFTPHDPEALERIEALEIRIRKEADRHFQEGLDHFKKNSMQAARKEFLNALTYNPDHKQALYYLKHHLTESDFILYETKEGATPRSIAREIYNDPDKDFLVAYFNNLDPGDRLKPGITLKLPIMESAWAARPAYPENMLAKAKALFTAGEYQKALSLAENILEYSPRNKEARYLINASYYQLGTMLLKQKKHQQSLGMFKKLDMDYKNTREMVLYIEKQLQDQAENHYRQGVGYFLAEKLDEAVKEWEQTLNLNPGHPRAKRDLERTRRLLENLRKLQ